MTAARIMARKASIGTRSPTAIGTAIINAVLSGCMEVYAGQPARRDETLEASDSAQQTYPLSIV